jgi:hypothetical protein
MAQQPALPHEGGKGLQVSEIAHFEHPSDYPARVLNQVPDLQIRVPEQAPKLFDDRLRWQRCGPPLDGFECDSKATAQRRGQLLEGVDLEAMPAGLVAVNRGRGTADPPSELRQGKTEFPAAAREGRGETIALTHLCIIMNDNGVTRKGAGQ